MVELSDAAKKQLEDYFSDKTASPIRVYAGGGCCSGPRLALALDDPRENDDSFAAGGFTFLVDKDLLAQTGNIRVDMTPYGFSVESDNPLEGGGSCASSGSCGGCGSSGSSCGG
ncbi:IscA/HesB family protein [Desulfovibrio aminophilus]|uniref:IscA/HesB family protein n=1 Tax=Desulfovibrio aminophilus TaxID=81425 RepID=UPI003399A65F